MARGLTMTNRPEKSLVNNSGERTIGIEIFLDQIVTAEPFVSLFPIREEVVKAIVNDMEENGFDSSKPVNIWRKPDGSRILIDGYTRVRAASQCGILRVTAYEREFANEDAALTYAIHTQRDRRNLDDATLLTLIQRLDHRQDGRKVSIAPRGAIESAPIKTAEITAELVGVSSRTVERIRTVLRDETATQAVLDGKKSISRASQDVIDKRRAPLTDPDLKQSRLTINIQSGSRKRLDNIWSSLGLTEEQGIWKALEEFARTHGVQL